MIQSKYRIYIILIFIGILMSIPLIAMQFSAEVNWTLFDFLVMGGLLLGTGLGCELTLRKFTKFRDRAILCGVILMLFLLTWAELAVGIFGTPFAWQ